MAAEPLTWELDVPLLTNRIIVGGVLRAFGLAGLIMGSLLSLLLVVQGEFDALGPIWLLTLGICAALAAVGLVAMLVIFRNRMRFRFTVTDDDVTVEQIDTTARAVNRLAVVAGAFAGSPSAAGSGLIAASQETQRVDFSGAFTVRLLPRARVIVFANGWRRLLYIYCTPENYELVAARVTEAMRAHGTAGRARRSPLPRYLGYTALAIAATLPSFMTVEAFDVSLLVPLLILCFALATLWLIGAFGWVVLGVGIFELVAIAMHGLSTADSFFEPGVTYARWTVFSGDDWAIIVLTALGLAVLAWLSIRAITGSLPSMLASDESDMAGEE
jgi:hypothetical protein